MKHKKTLLILGLVAGTAIIIMMKLNSSVDTIPQTEQSTHGYTHSLDVKIEPVISEDYKKLEKTKSLENVKMSVRFLRSLAFSPNSENLLMASLKQVGLDPKLGIDENPHSGAMYMIRSQKEIPGVRYFHAQYFVDDNGIKQAQHMSFDFPPQQGNFEKAITVVKAEFGGLGEPIYDKPNYKHWELGNGYVVYISRLDKQDMKDDPFSAYDLENDIGTVKVVVEEDPHHGLHGDETEMVTLDHDHNEG